MKIPDVVDQLPTDDAVRLVYGEPYQTADGGTVITVARVRRRGKRRRDEDAGEFTARPVGVFVIHDKQARWVPAVDMNRIALIGVITGLLAAVITSLAVLRRPPWPDLSGWPS
jgi:hypothetical protein